MSLNIENLRRYTYPEKDGGQWPYGGRMFLGEKLIAEDHGYTEKEVDTKQRAYIEFLKEQA